MGGGQHRKGALARFFSAIVLTSSGTLQASLEMLRYTDTNNNTVQAESTREYINPVSSVELYISAGTGQRIRTTLVNTADGSTAFSHETHALGSSDKITIGEDTYPGAVVTLPGTVADASYTLTIDYLQSNMVVTSEEYSKVFDRVAPKVTEFRGFTYNLGRTGIGGLLTSEKQLSHAEGQRVYGVLDESVDRIATATFTSYYVDGENAGQPFAVKPANLGYNQSLDKHLVSIGWSSNSALRSGGFYPTLNGRIKTSFSVVDKAGNVGGGELEHYLHWICSSADSQFEPFAVYDPTWPLSPVPGMPFEGYRPYSSGMEIRENPFKVMYRIPKEKHYVSDAMFGYRIVGGYKLETHSDEDYVYEITKAYYEDEQLRFQGFPYNLMRSSGFYHCGYTDLRTSLVAGAGVPESPSKPVVKTFIDGVDRGTGLLRFNTDSGVVTITQLQAIAEPRSYDQVFVTNYGFGECTIPAGETSCSVYPEKAFGRPDDIQYYHITAYLKSTDGELRGERHIINLRSDLLPPVLDDLTFDPDSRIYKLKATEYKTGAIWNDIRMAGASISLTNTATGAVQTLSPSSAANSGDQSEYSFNVASVSDGRYSVSSLVRDNYSNRVVTNHEPLVFDSEAPSVQIAQLPSDYMRIERIDGLTVQVSDAVDSDPELVSVELTGGPDNVRYMLSRQKQSAGIFTVGVPAIFPSDSQSYRIRAVVEDINGNTRVYTRSFYYVPALVGNTWGDIVNVPTTDFAIFDASTGRSTLYSEVLIDSYDQPVEGVYEIQATLSPESTTPIELNGTVIQPGESVQVHNAYDLGENGSRIHLPIRPLQLGKEAKVLLLTSAPSAPGVQFTMTSHRPSLAINASSETPRQLDEVHFDTQLGNGYCQPVYETPDNTAAAQQADPFSDPVCLFSWLEQIEGAQIDEATGQMSVEVVEMGENRVAIAPYMYVNGERLVLDVAEKTIDVSSLEVYASVPESVPSAAQTKIELFNFALENPEQCKLVTSETAAREQREDTCMIELTTVPPGFEDPYMRRYTKRRGYFEAAGSYRFAWRVGVFSQRGELVWSEEQYHEVDVFDPEPPAFEYTRANWLETGDVAVSYADPVPLLLIRNTTDAEVDITITSDRLSDPIHYENVRPGHYKPVKSFEAPMWDRGDYQIAIRYTRYPEIETLDAFSAIVMPSVRLVTSLNGERTHLDTDAYQVHFKLGQMVSQELDYNVATMGEWDVYLAVSEDGEEVPVTEPQQLSAEGVYFTIDAQTLQALERQPRYFAVAKLRAPDERLEREIVSRAIAPKILKGTEILANVEATVTEGAAPLSTRLRLTGESDELRALGDIQWQYSADGEVWSDIEDATRTSLYMQVDEGDHQFRAVLVNKHSGVVSYSETAAVWAYAPIEVVVAGTEHTAPGVPAQLTAQAASEGSPLDNAEYEWIYRDRGGETIVATGQTFSFTSEVPVSQIFTVRARRAEADGGLRRSWATTRARVIVEDPRAPRVSVRGPSIVEVGGSYEYTAVTLPSWRDRATTQNVIEEWELPDGTVVAGNQAVWTPTQSFMDEVGFGAYVSVKHRAWVDGYRETSLRESSRRVRIWKYEWPNFGVATRSRYAEAPTDISFDVRPDDVTWYRRTFGEPISYSWVVPDGLELTYERNNRIVVRALEEGDYTVSVTVSDSRGNATTVDSTVSVLPTPPYDVTMQASPSNRYARTPFDIAVRVRTDGGHRENRVANIKYILDNETVLEGLQRYPRIPFGEPGDKTLSVVVETELGITSESSVLVSGYANKPPTCEYISYRTSYALSVEAKCADPDGYISSYRWFKDGEELALTSRRVSIALKDIPESGSLVTTEILDDGGATVDLSELFMP